MCSYCEVGHHRTQYEHKYNLHVRYMYTPQFFFLFFFWRGGGGLRSPLGYGLDLRFTGSGKLIISSMRTQSRRHTHAHDNEIHVYYIDPISLFSIINRLFTCIGYFRSASHIGHFSSASCFVTSLPVSLAWCPSPPPPPPPPPRKMSPRTSNPRQLCPLCIIIIVRGTMVPRNECPGDSGD